MKAKTLQIIWHSKDPVFSIDFHPDGYLATGGGDKDIKVSILAATSAGCAADCCFSLAQLSLLLCVVASACECSHCCWLQQTAWLTLSSICGGVYVNRMHCCIMVYKNLDWIAAAAMGDVL
jgi:WD40 repeat protein